jgi:hypothetical protein
MPSNRWASAGKVSGSDSPSAKRSWKSNMTTCAEGEGLGRGAKFVLQLPTAAAR